MAVEQVAEFEVFAEHIEPLVPAEPLELGGVDAALRAGGERPALEAVPAELARREAGSGCRFPLAAAVYPYGLH